MQHDELFRLAADPGAEPGALAEISRSSLEDVRIAVAQNQRTDARTLLGFVSDPSDKVRSAMAANPSFLISDQLLEVRCKHIGLRLVTPGDAEFILSLRRDQRLNEFLSPVKDDLEEQVRWIDAYKMKEAHGVELYFIITIQGDAPCGAVRLYDFRGRSFCWGSWIIAPGSPFYVAIESALAVYELAFGLLGFTHTHFDVRKGNAGVLKFLTGFGAQVSSEDARNYYFCFSRDAYQQIRPKYARYLLAAASE